MKSKNAVIFTRGADAIEQKLLCYFYASDNNIDVLFDTNDIDEVVDCEGCEVMLVAKPSRISRDALKYHRIVKTLKSKGIETVFTATEKSAERFIDFLMKDLAKKENII